MGAQILEPILVMVTVIAGGAEMPEMRTWQSAPNANFESVVSDWAGAEGVKTVEIAPEIAEIDLGSLTLTATDLCGALDRLVQSLRHANPRPQVASCDVAQSRLEITTAAAGPEPAPLTSAPPDSTR